MSKLRKSNLKVKSSSYGGVLALDKLLRSVNLYQYLDNKLGKRVKQAKYTYSEILRPFFLGYIGSCSRIFGLKDFKQHLQIKEGEEIPSIDQIYRTLKSFKEEDQPVKLKTSNAKSPFPHMFNYNKKLNGILVDLAFDKLKLLNKKDDLILDMDVAPIFCKKYDARMTYHKEYGYAPHYGFISNHKNEGVLCYVENRTGNVSPKSGIIDSFDRFIENLNRKNIQVSKFRLDGAYYDRSGLLKKIDAMGGKFYTRPFRSKSLFEIAENKFDMGLNVKKVIIQEQEMEVVSVSKMNHANSTGMDGRHIVFRVKKDYAPNDAVFVIDNYCYFAYFTNDWEMEPEDVMQFYNQRGTVVENTIGNNNNDFNFNKLPFSFCDENSAYLCFTAMASMIYKYAINRICKKVKTINPTMELKTVRRKFFAIPIMFVQTETEMEYALDPDHEFLQEFL